MDHPPGENTLEPARGVSRLLKPFLEGRRAWYEHEKLVTEIAVAYEICDSRRDDAAKAKV